MKNAIHAVSEFLTGIKNRDYEKVKNNCQLTWLYTHDLNDVFEALPKIESFKVKKGNEVMPGVIDLDLSFNERYVSKVRVMREVAPYKPDPDGENGQWGVQVSSFIRNIHERS
jgi:hypothetical protein